MALGTQPQERVRIFDRNGLPLCEFRASVSRSWILGAEGRASFTLASRDAACREKYLQFGNWLLVENSVLPAWAGMIDAPREWKARTVTVNAYTPERLLSLRRITGDRDYNAGGAGSIFQRILELASELEYSPVEAGSIRTGSKFQELEIRPYPLSQWLKTLQIQSGEEYNWKPVVDLNNKLTVYGDWSAQVGVDTRLWLTEGIGGGNVKLSDNAYTEDAPLFNNLVGYGNGAVWWQRPQANVKNSDSVRKYGLRQATLEYNTDDAGIIETNLTNYLKLVKDSRKTYGVSALNTGNTFANIALGNKVTLNLESVGFSGVTADVRIYGMMYNPARGQIIDLALREL